MPTCKCNIFRGHLLLLHWAGAGYPGVFRLLIHDMYISCRAFKPLSDPFCSRRTPTECWTKQDIYTQENQSTPFVRRRIWGKSLEMFANMKWGQTSFAKVGKSPNNLEWGVTQNITPPLPPPLFSLIRWIPSRLTLLKSDASNTYYDLDKMCNFVLTCFWM